MGLNSAVYLLAVSNPGYPFSDSAIMCFTSLEERDLYYYDCISRGLLACIDSDFIDKDLL